MPVADCAVTLLDYEGYTGEAMAIGERTPLALIDAPRVGAHGGRRGDHQRRRRAHRALAHVKLSANWMAAAGYPGEDAALYDTVRAVGARACPALGVSIPVGKDSLSMRPRGTAKRSWPRCRSSCRRSRRSKTRRDTLTPQLRTDAGDTELILIDLGRGRNRLELAVDVDQDRCVSRVGYVMHGACHYSSFKGSWPQFIRL